MSAVSRKNRDGIDRVRAADVLGTLDVPDDGVLGITAAASYMEEQW